MVYKDLDPELLEIFYSPHRDSCVYTFEYFPIGCDNVFDDASMQRQAYCLDKEKQARDFLTKEYLFDSSDLDKCFERATDESSCRTFNARLDDLK